MLMASDSLRVIGVIDHLGKECTHMRRNFVELRQAETSAILMGIMIFQLICFISWGVVCRQIPEFAIFINLDVLNQIFGVYGLSILMALAWAALCLHWRMHASRQSILVIGALLIYVVVMSFAGFVSGLLAMSLGVVMAAAPMIGIMILPAHLVLGATLLAAVGLGSLCYFSMIGEIVYAPLFKQQILGESADYGLFYFCSQLCFVVPFLVIIIAATHLFLTQWRARESHVRYMSQTDALTGVYNRRFAHQYLGESIRRVDHQPVTVALLDLDHFKQINDQHGHLIGDDALRLTANTLREHLRGQDVVARFGGEEFILIFHGAEQMTWYSASGAVPITASFGVAGVSHAGQAIDEVLQHADEALYVAKKQGRNQVVVTSAVSDVSKNSTTLVSLLK
jgi:GGDEF domain-containing protein